MTNYFNRKVVLLVGGAGSLGRRLAVEFLKPEYDVRTLRILDINENGLARLRWKIGHDNRTRWLLGNILDRDRMIRAMENVDVVLMLAAQKHVEFGEANPFFSLQTNVLGAQSCIDAALEADVDKYIYVSSDKSCQATSVYGRCKALAESLTLDANNYKGDRRVQLSVVRPPNYINSDGSVFQRWRFQQKKGLPITLTSPEMSRYFMSFSDMTTFIMRCVELMKGGEIFIPQNVKKMKIIDLAKQISDNIEIIGLRPGEKLEEILIDPAEEARAEIVDNIWVIKQ